MPCPFSHAAADATPPATIPKPPGGRLPVTREPMSRFTDDPAACMRKLWAEHGPIAALEQDGRQLLFLFDPALNKQVLSDDRRYHSRFFAVRGPRKSAHRRVTSGLLSMNGDLHKDHRRVIKAPFSKKAIAGYHEDIVAESDKTFERWEFAARAASVGRRPEPRDINADMTEFMLRLTCTILFGLDDEALALKVGELTEHWVHLNHQIGPLAFAPDKDLNDRYDELLEAAVELETALNEMVAAKRDQPPGRDVLSLLLQAYDAEGMSDGHLAGHMALLFGAAHLTNAHTLTWTHFLLAQHPVVRKQVADELDAVLGQSAPGRRELTPEDTTRLPVLERMLKESMRVLPASSYSQRFTAEPVKLGPFDLPAGVPIIFSQFMTHHLPGLYPEPEKFRPSRWDSITPGPYEYLPFGAGGRRCIGAALGMMQLMTFLPRMLSRFKFTLEPGTRVDAKIVSTMLNPMTPVLGRVETDDGRYAASPCTGSVHTIVDLPPVATPVRRAAGM